jgi:hypothetical protein
MDRGRPLSGDLGVCVQPSASMAAGEPDAAAIETNIRRPRFGFRRRPIVRWYRVGFTREFHAIRPGRRPTTEPGFQVATLQDTDVRNEALRLTFGRIRLSVAPLS